MRRSLIATVLLASVASLSAQRPQSVATSIQGVWKVSEVESNGVVNRNPQPGLYIFTRGYFSIVQVTSAEPRKPNPAPATVDEYAALYGNGAFVASSGTYEVTAPDTIVTRGLVAKNPGGMTPNSFTNRRFTVSSDGKMLSLTTVTNQQGQAGRGDALKLTRVE